MMRRVFVSGHSEALAATMRAPDARAAFLEKAFNATALAIAVRATLDA
jgi:hypothetical protein